MRPRAIVQADCKNSSSRVGERGGCVAGFDGVAWVVRIGGVGASGIGQSLLRVSRHRVGGAGMRGAICLVSRLAEYLAKQLTPSICGGAHKPGSGVGAVACCSSCGR